jgi:shikimate kinase
MISTHTNVVLVGFMGTGKSSVGKLVATRMRFQFVDNDSIIVERAGMEITEIFEKHGEATFRDYETRALESIAHLNRCVVSTGGGAVLREENRALLQRIGLVVLLTAREEVIYDRVARNTKRPLLSTEDPRERISTILAQRREAYASVAQVTVDTSDLTREQAAEAVIAEAKKAFGWTAPH